VGESAASLDATPDAFGRVPFAMMDILRRALGHAFGAFGLDPDECPYRIVGVGPHWRLRDYGGHDRSLSLLIVAAPIKRAYIWDLAPSVSAVRYCMQAGLHVHLLEWMPASHWGQNNGLDEYTEAISECVAKISGRAPGNTPFLVGHSLGGTIAAIFTAWARGDPSDVSSTVQMTAEAMNRTCPNASSIGRSTDFRYRCLSAPAPRKCRSDIEVGSEHVRFRISANWIGRPKVCSGTKRTKFEWAVNVSY
jgi:hypothetical protein